jgi:hypothetical protein
VPPNKLLKALTQLIHPAFAALLAIFPNFTPKILEKDGERKNT